MIGSKAPSQGTSLKQFIVPKYGGSTSPPSEISLLLAVSHTVSACRNKQILFWLSVGTYKSHKIKGLCDRVLRSPRRVLRFLAEAQRVSNLIFKIMHAVDTQGQLSLNRTPFGKTQS